MYRSAPPARERTLLDVLRESVTRWPEAIALDDGGEPLSYRDLDRRVTEVARRLHRAGVGAGDRVGVRIPSGGADLYIGVLGVLTAGAAYVPVDAEDPAERAELVWREAGVCAVLGPGGRAAAVPGTPPGGLPRAPEPADDAWIIFTSGSTGKPKGVAITHRSAAAFADAEAALFVPDAPIGPGDRVLAGLSVGFDASCEEMWLAWRHGAALVPAPRALVRTGAELGPWLGERRITVVSTVPSLAALWSADMLAGVRLLIVGGEACPPEVVRRFARDGREVWNTYGPTETTVVACAARLHDGEPVRIGLPLNGWELAVTDRNGVPVPCGESGELVIGGVGLGRYLDTGKDAERFAPLPALGWQRAYRSGDLVRATPEGLEFTGRADDQIKIGGRRVELGEIDAALLALPQVSAAAATVRRTPGGLDVLVGYLVPSHGDPGRFDRADALRRLRETLPAALVPRLAVLPRFPLKSSGKVDRAALPWPLPAGAPGPGHEPGAGAGHADPVTHRLLGLWSDLLGVQAGPGDDFFDQGGTSLAAARLISALREHHPHISVADLYRHPTPGALRTLLTEKPPAPPAPRAPQPPSATGPAPAAAPPRTPWWTGCLQLAAQPLLHTVAGLRWLLAIALAGTALTSAGYQGWLPTLSWWLLIPGYALLFTLPGKVLLAAGGVRLLRGTRLTPGELPRGGGAHLRLWAAERLVTALGLTTITGTPLVVWYARLLGCRVGQRVDLRALPPVTGLGTFGDGCAVEPEADLAGWWLDGAVVRIGPVAVGAGARVGARVTLLPGAELGAGAEVLPGGSLAGRVPAGECWGGSPAVRQPAEYTWPAARGTRSRGWALGYALTPALRALLLWVAWVPSLVLAHALPSTGGTAELTLRLPVLVVLGMVCHALFLTLAVRLAGRSLRPGVHRVDSLPAWAAWLAHDLMDTSRRTLFPLYASLFTPLWLRMQGARIGRCVEASTVLALPRLLRVRDGAFLADQVLAAPYELRGGWLRLGISRVGERAFVGNSGLVGPGRRVGDGALVGVLTDTPERVPAGSSWLGNPAMRLRRVAETHDVARTYAPPLALYAARAAVELCRAVPLLLAGMLRLTTLAVLLLVWSAGPTWLLPVVCGPLLWAAGLVAGAVTTAAKWVLMGRFRPGRHPLWSPFVWRNELYDCFVEVLAVPWLVQPATGTPLLNWWLRSLGVRVGRGVWCESHWLPEPDLVRLGAGAAVNRGCVLQTHLFHDRVMRLEPVVVGGSATVGPHSITLPGSEVGAGTSVGAGSLLMAAERLPGDGRWQGNPVRPVPAG